MSIKETKCVSCGEIYNPSDSPYKGDLHLKKCEKCFHLGMQRDAKLSAWTAIIIGVFLTWVFSEDTKILLPAIIVSISTIIAVNKLNEHKEWDHERILNERAELKRHFSKPS